MQNFKYRASVKHIELELGIVREDEPSCAMECEDSNPRIISGKQNHQKRSLELLHRTNQQKTIKVQIEDVKPTADAQINPETSVSEVKRKLEQLIQFYNALTKSLDINHPKPDRAIKILKIFKTSVLAEITPLMLLKYPKVLARLKCVRKYAGNLEKWNLSEDEEKVFKKKALKICLLAINIYNCIQVSCNGLLIPIDL